MPTPLSAQLDARTAEGELYEKLPDGVVRCVACGHRCLIRDGRRGICKVRYNEGGTLHVPRNYVAALQCDPVEKKPFNHVLPGANALTFGMLGCDFHCGYCFVGQTMIVTQRGPRSFEALFEAAARKERGADAEMAYPDDLLAVTGSGGLERVLGVVRHRWRGELTVLRPYFLPRIRCTPDHRVYATTDPAILPRKVAARQLTPDHLLAIPRHFTPGAPQEIDVETLLGGRRVTHRTVWKLTRAERERVLTATAEGWSPRETGALVGGDPSYVRHVRSKLARASDPESRTRCLVVDADSVRFPKEHRPGIPRRIPVDEEFARLLGYYCAKGCVVRDRARPNSHVLSFSFSHEEHDAVDQVRELLDRVLRVRARRVPRSTTLAVVAGRSSAAALFEELAGRGSRSKRVPDAVVRSPEPIVRALLDALVEGDGHRYQNGKVHVTTVSRDLAFGIAWLALRLGMLPSIYSTRLEETGLIEGRTVRRAPIQYSVVWYEGDEAMRHVRTTDAFHLVPLREVGAEPFDGLVYNMEVEGEHNYLANFALVANCQNWVTSQTLRDTSAGVTPTDLTAEQLVDYGERCDARLVVSSYNEPLITSEWAVEVFRLARARGLVTGFVSNGNATPEALDYVRPHADVYKIDLKTMSDRNYRQLGGVLQHVLDSIRMVHERGLWLEVLTLVIPGFSSDEGQLRAAAEYIAGIDPTIPWHVTAFHEDYKFHGMGNTTVQHLLRACEIGAQAGLKFVYAGNLPGRVGRWEHTHCPACDERLVARFGYHILENRMTAAGACPRCATPIPGLWRNPRGSSEPSRGHGGIRPLR